MSVAPRSPQFKVRADLAHRTIDDEQVILDLRSGIYFGLNASATILWNSLSSAPASVGKLAALLRRQFAIDLKTARHDTRAWVNQLVDRGLLEKANG